MCVIQDSLSFKKVKLGFIDNWKRKMVMFEMECMPYKINCREIGQLEKGDSDNKDSSDSDRDDD